MEEQTARPFSSDRGGRGRAFPIAVIAAVLAALIAFAGLTVYALFRQREGYRQQLENLYHRSFYELNDDLNNLEVKLSKLMVASGGVEVIRYLNDVTRQTDTASVSLATLPASESTLLKLTKFVNQTGDFCNSLVSKVAEGGALSAEDLQTIEELYDISLTLSNEVGAMTEKINQGYLFTSHHENTLGTDPYLDENFSAIEDAETEYPSMIYDGPFSDALENIEPKGLPAEEVDRAAAEQNLRDQLAFLGELTVEYQKETDGLLATFDFQVTDAEGRSFFVQMTKRGGKVLLMDNMRKLDESRFSPEECVEKAEAFARSLGFESLEGVWVSDYYGYAYVNLAPVENGVVYYPDLVKVIVARDTGEILGFEAKTYYTNHTARTLEEPKLTRLAARQTVFDSLDIESEKLTLIPLTGQTEVLCYEFYGTYRGLKYFVYVDASTGEEVNILRVIDSEQGSLVQ